MFQIAEHAPLTQQAVFLRAETRVAAVICWRCQEADMAQGVLIMYCLVLTSRSQLWQCTPQGQHCMPSTIFIWEGLGKAYHSGYAWCLLIGRRLCLTHRIAFALINSTGSQGIPWDGISLEKAGAFSTCHSNMEGLPLVLSSREQKGVSLFSPTRMEALALLGSPTGHGSQAAHQQVHSWTLHLAPSLSNSQTPVAQGAQQAVQRCPW